MGIMDDAKDVAETAGRSLKDAWDDTTERISDKADEAKADADVKKAEAEKERVQQRNEAKEALRDN